MISSGFGDISAATMYRQWVGVGGRQGHAGIVQGVSWKAGAEMAQALAGGRSLEQGTGSRVRRTG